MNAKRFCNEATQSNQENWGFHLENNMQGDTTYVNIMTEGLFEYTSWKYFCLENEYNLLCVFPRRKPRINEFKLQEDRFWLNIRKS